MGAENNDIPKYLKRQPSSVSKASHKSKHKHQYKECLIEDRDRVCLAKYCTVCGKVIDINYFKADRINGHY